jgi:hypothetical protein
MEVITDSYDNISMGQLFNKLSQKFAQLDKLEAKEQLEKAANGKDYFENGSVPSNLDEKDFQRVLQKFKNADAKIRSHEQIHASIGHTTTPISYTYSQGPDGKMYAVGGHVRLDTSIPDDPKAAQFKLDQIQKSASAPSDPSGADMMISSQANLNKLLVQIKGDEDAHKQQS